MNVAKDSSLCIKREAPTQTSKKIWEGDGWQDVERERLITV